MSDWDKYPASGSEEVARERGTISSERTYTAEEVALERAVILREAAEVLNAIGGMPDGFCVCFNSFRDPLKSEHTGECQAARAFLAIPTDQPALDRHDAVLTARTIKVCNEQTLKELQSGICCIPGANELLAERVRQAVLAHTIEARRLYLGTSPENYLNWLEKRIEAGRAALEAGDKAGDPK